MRHAWIHRARTEFLQQVVLVPLLLVLPASSECPCQDCDADGYTIDEGDCDDNDVSIHPGAEEICDGIDNNCDGETDEGIKTTSYPDVDGDGYGDASSPLEACHAPEGFVTNATDCDDRNSAIHPGATEACDNVDNDCDAQVDEGLLHTYYADRDGDHYGDPSSSMKACSLPAGYSTNKTDCNDLDSAVHPGAKELCDGIDNDCDGVVDEGAAVTGLYYVDNDGDGFGGEKADMCLFTAMSTKRGDCDDEDPTIHPGANDPYGDGIDQDCGAFDGLDPHVGLTSSSYALIQDALDEAVPGTVVWVGPGTYLEHDLSYRGKDIVLESTGGSAVTTINAGSLGRVLVFEASEGPDAIVRGFTLTGGSGTLAGGVLVSDASPTLEELIFVGNQAAEKGGGLYTSGSSSLSISGCTFSQNTSISGGGLYAEASSLSIFGCTFSQNTSISGGGLYAEASSLTMTDSVLEKHVNYNTEDSGGGAYLHDSSALIERCSFTSNRFGDYGGGIYIDGGVVTVNDSQFKGNSTYRYGGGLYSAGGTITINESEFRQNSASDGGGGVSCGSNVTLNGCLLEDNSSPVEGGGAKGSGRFNHCTFQGNTAPQGGGLSGYGAILNNCSFIENTADYGGGAYLSTDYDHLSHCQFRDNSATYGGGGIQIAYKSPTLEYCYLVGNTAPNGGGIYIRTPECCTHPAPRIDHCVLIGNSSGLGAGQDSRVTATNSIFAYNAGCNVYTEYLAQITLTYSDLYNPEGLCNYIEYTDHPIDDPEFPPDTTPDSPTVLTVEPELLEYDADEYPIDPHLTTMSPLVDAGDPSVTDPDGSRGDMGLFGGPGGGGTDLDGDGFFNYYWPGTISDAPQGEDPTQWDCDDDNPSSHLCP